MMYVGPDQFIPLSSFLGTVLGVVLIFWRRLTLWLQKITQALFSRQGDDKVGLP
jgi:hypothetical protein